VLPIVASNDSWLRIHRVEHGPLFFGRTCSNRFDAPGGEFGVLYVGATTDAALIETFGHATGDNFVQRSELLLRGISVIGSTAQLKLVDLTGPGLARIGADERLCSGSQQLARRWSAALYSHSINPDGLLFRARHDPSQMCAAFFDRAEPHLVIRKTTRLSDAAFEDELLEFLLKYDFGLAES
jgi:hypothetical protein